MLLSPGKTLDQSLDGKKGRIYVVQTSGLKEKRLKGPRRGRHHDQVEWNRNFDAEGDETYIFVSRQLRSRG